MLGVSHATDECNRGDAFQVFSQGMHVVTMEELQKLMMPEL